MTATSRAFVTSYMRVHAKAAEISVTVVPLVHGILKAIRFPRAYAKELRVISATVGRAEFLCYDPFKMVEVGVPADTLSVVEDDCMDHAFVPGETTLPVTSGGAFSGMGGFVPWVNPATPLVMKLRAAHPIPSFRVGILVEEWHQ